MSSEPNQISDIASKFALVFIVKYRKLNFNMDIYRASYIFLYLNVLGNYYFFFFTGSSNKLEKNPFPFSILILRKYTGYNYCVFRVLKK